MSKYTEAVERRLKGLSAVSTGACPDCADCANNRGMDLGMYNNAHEAGDINAEGSFSWRACEVCGSTLGGERHEWHAVDKNGDVIHGDDACTDCVLYLANGEEPEGN